MWLCHAERKQLVMRRTLYGPDHEAFRESAREFVNRNILPVAEKLIDQRFIDREIWLEAGRNGFLGLEVPERTAEAKPATTASTRFWPKSSRAPVQLLPRASAFTPTSLLPTSFSSPPKSRSSVGCPSSAPVRC